MENDHCNFHLILPTVYQNIAAQSTYTFIYACCLNTIVGWLKFASSGYTAAVDNSLKTGASNEIL